MKALTPMKRLSDNISRLESNLGGSWKRLMLNKAAPKATALCVGRTTGESMTKGVESDCIYIYSFRDKKFPSFSFVFQYQEKDQPETFFAQIKYTNDNDSIVTSVEMNYEDFRKNLNLFINNVDTSDKKLNAVIDIFEKQFLSATLQKEIEESFEVFQAASKNIDAETDVSNLNKIYESNLSVHKSAVESSRIEKSTIKEHAEILELTKRLEFLKRKVKLQEDSADRKFDVQKKKEVADNSYRSYLIAKGRSISLKKKELEKIPFTLRFGVIKNLSDEDKQILDL